MLGRVAGAPVVLAPSALVGAVIIALIFYPAVSSLGSTGIVVAAAFVVLLFASILAHELAHGLTAKACGQQPHAFVLTLWGGHTAFQGASLTPGVTALVAVVGPVTNLVLALGFYVAVSLAAPYSVVAWLLGAGAVTNAFVGVFNLLPGLPLDGGRILEAAVWAATGRRSAGTMAAGWSGRVVAILTVVLAMGLPVLRGGVPSMWTVVWSVFIALFLWSGATGAIRYARQTRNIGTLSVASVGRPAVGVLHSSTLEQALHTARAAQVEIVVLLGDDGQPVGYVDPQAVASVPPARLGVTPVSAVAVELPGQPVVDASVSGEALLAAVGKGTSPLIATRGGLVVAVVVPADVVHALRV